MIDDILKNRKHVLEFTDEVPSKELIDSLLQRTWKVTPSKNNFMAYTIHVVTDKDKRKAIYNMCISNEKQLNDDNTLLNENLLCILTAPYVLIFVNRFEDKPNQRQQELIKQGVYYEAVDPDKFETLFSTNSIEVGMFAKTLTGLCLENNLDISYTKCFSIDKRDWKETVPYVNTAPLLIMSIGKGKTYREVKSNDLRPNFERIINWVK